MTPVQVTYDAGNGQPPTHLQTMHGGEPTAYFGERSLLKRAPAVASVRAVEDTDLLYLPKETFASLLMHGTEKELLASQVSERDAMLREKSRPARIMWDDLQIKSVLGTGSFGRVRFVTHKSTGSHWAIKILKKSEVISGELPAAMKMQMQHGETFPLSVPPTMLDAEYWLVDLA